MHRAAASVLVFAFACSLLAAQSSTKTVTSPPPPQEKAAQEETVTPSGIKLSASAQLVVVDVSVTDRSGHAVHGLKSSDFILEERKAPQTVRNFEEHAAVDRAATPAAPPLKLPAGTFTDYLNVPEDAPLNVLLLDALNTPMKDQSYVRYQLQQYVKTAQPGTRIAIFGLTTHLILLQGFTSDPAILKNVVEHKLLPRASVLLDDPAGSNVDTQSMSDMMSDAGASAQSVAGMQQFEAESASFQTQLRMQYTIDAFGALARYLASFPGRKNLLWFSGSFPLTIFGDSSLDDPFAVQRDFSDALRQTASLLARGRVAVFPIDARGLQTNPYFSASRSNSGSARNPQAMTNAIASFGTQNAQEHMSMDEIADDTGGHAFYNTNGLADAVRKALDAGANFYTLTYSPANKKWDSGYRSIKVSLQGAAAARGLHLSYRHGYYAEDPDNKKTAASSSIVAAKPQDTPVQATSSYARLAMDRGAPAPSEILFKVRVLPASTAPEDEIAPNNNADPKLKGPFRRYEVDFAALARDVSLPLATDGTRSGTLEFLTLVYDSQGKLLNASEGTVNMHLQPVTYAKLLKGGIGFHMEISAPAKAESFLRIGVHDVTSGKYGVVEVPTETVSHLPPLPPTPATSTPTQPAAATPAAVATPAAAPPASPAPQEKH
jgi:VWFA-related protein